MALLFYVEYDMVEDSMGTNLGLKFLGPYNSIESLEREMFQLVRNRTVDLSKQFGVVTPSIIHLMDLVGSIDFDGKLVPANQEEVDKNAA